MVLEQDEKGNTIDRSNDEEFKEFQEHSIGLQIARCLLDAVKDLCHSSFIKEPGIDVNELAQSVGVHPNEVTLLVHGELGDIKVRELVRVFYALNKRIVISTAPLSLDVGSPQEIKKKDDVPPA